MVQPLPAWEAGIDRRSVLASIAAGAVLASGAAVSSCTAPPPVHSALIETLAETIIPTTSTVGAREAGVPGFIEMIVQSWFTPDERARFKAGMRSFEEAARRIAGVSFIAMSPADRLRTVQAICAGEQAQAGRHDSAERYFLSQMKALTLHGYYTSEAGASQELTLNLVPGHYLACEELEAGQHAFSLGRTNAVLRLP